MRAILSDPSYTDAVTLPWPDLCYGGAPVMSYGPTPCANGEHRWEIVAEGQEVDARYLGDEGWKMRTEVSELITTSRRQAVCRCGARRDGEDVRVEIVRDRKR